MLDENYTPKILTLQDIREFAADLDALLAFAGYRRVSEEMGCDCRDVPDLIRGTAAALAELMNGGKPHDKH